LLIIPIYSPRIMRKYFRGAVLTAPGGIYGETRLADKRITAVRFKIQFSQGMNVKCLPRAGFPSAPLSGLSLVLRRSPFHYS
jgi:hypothetical protein